MAENPYNIGISAHFHQLLSNLRYDSNHLKPPSNQLLLEIKKLQKILQQKQQSVKKTIKLQQRLQKSEQSIQITKDDILTLEHLKKQLKDNEQTLKIAKICQQIDVSLMNFQDSNIKDMENNRNDFIKYLSTKDSIFKQLYYLITQFDNQINTIVSHRDKSRPNKQNQSDKYQYRDTLLLHTNQQNEQELDDNFSEKLIQIRNKYLRKLKKNLYKAMIRNYYYQKHNGETYLQKLKQALQYFNLPFKPKIKTNQRSQPQIFYCNFLTQALFTQYCYYCLIKQVDYVMDDNSHDQITTQQNSKEQTMNTSVRIKSEFKSPFFKCLWQNIIKSTRYIFMNNGKDYTHFNEQNAGYQIDEPGWMFEYIQNAFVINFQYITRNILLCDNFPQQYYEKQVSLQEQSNLLENQDDQKSNTVIKLTLSNEKLIKQFTQQIQVYFFGYNIQQMFLVCIVQRFQTDILSLIQTSKLSIPGYHANKKPILNPNKALSQDQQKQRKQVNFIFFNFLDQLYSLEQKLTLRFDNQINLVESIIKIFMNPSQYLINSKLPAINILEYSLLYQHQWIQQRIFKEFYNINYSNITDLRNIQSYNIVINFIQLFDKLYSKFKAIKMENIKKQINQFYSDIILRLVRHIKSSFTKIYNYNTGQLDKYEILMGFKKVQEEFKGYFDGFFKTLPGFQMKIQQQYYNVIAESCNVYALQQLNSIHKKVYKALTEFSQNYSKSTNPNADKQTKQKHINKWQKIYKEWEKRLQKINRLTSTQSSFKSVLKSQMFIDSKLKNIFYVYLESIDFSFEGYQMFMELFQPFLVAMYSRENYKMLKMLIEMDKATLKQYLHSHQGTISFLTGSQIKSIQRVKIQ